MKREGGITLIALVITIIVLLILAGVSISLVVGDNGILEQATAATVETGEAKAKEEVTLAWGSAYSEYSEAWTKDTSKQKAEYFTEENLNKYLVETGTVSNLVYVENGESTLTYTSYEDNLTYSLKIDIYGNVVSNKGLLLNKAIISFNLNNATYTTETLTVTKTGITEEVTWANSNPAVATISGTTGDSITVEKVGVGTAIITATCEGYTAQCEVKVKNVLNAANITKDYYGKTVDYGATYADASTIGGIAGTGKWEIFYADNEHIYLIAQGCLARAVLQTSYNGIAYGCFTDFNDATKLANYPAVSAGWLSKIYDPSLAEGSRLKYTSENDNTQATQYLLDKRVWGSYANSDADWAIGGPTLEMLVASYDAYKGTITAIADPSVYGGYESTINSGLTKGTYLNHYTGSGDVPDYYWLTCPFRGYDADLGFFGYGLNGIVNGDDENVSQEHYKTRYGFRPVVCLKSSVSLVESDGDYDYTIQ